MIYRLIILIHIICQCFKIICLWNNENSSLGCYRFIEAKKQGQADKTAIFNSSMCTCSRPDIKFIYFSFNMHEIELQTCCATQLFTGTSLQFPSFCSHYLAQILSVFTVQWWFRFSWKSELSGEKDNAWQKHEGACCFHFLLEQMWLYTEHFMRQRSTKITFKHHIYTYIIKVSVTAHHWFLISIIMQMFFHFSIYFQYWIKMAK